MPLISNNAIGVPDFHRFRNSRMQDVDIASLCHNSHTLLYKKRRHLQNLQKRVYEEEEKHIAFMISV